MKKIIVNADDFGYHEFINRAIEKSVREGCVRSTTMMAGGAAFDDAVKIANRNPNLGVGVHFTLVDCAPVLPPEEIPTLVTEKGTLFETYEKFVTAYCQGKISNDEIKSELAAQIEKIRRAGLKITHFDSHTHLHHLPGVSEIAFEVAGAAGIKKVRIADTKILDKSPKTFRQICTLFGFSILTKIARKKAQEKNFLTPENFAGLIGNRSVSEEFLSDVIENMQEGTTEVMVHVGTNNKILQDYCNWNHDYEQELAAVTSPKILQLLEEKNIVVTNYEELLAEK